MHKTLNSWRSIGLAVSIMLATLIPIGSAFAAEQVVGPPANPRVFPWNDTDLGVEWNGPIFGSATDYQIRFSSDAGANWTLYPDPESASRFMALSNLSKSKTYWIQVRSVNNAGPSDWATARPVGGNQISFASSHSCAIVFGQYPKCWGGNNSGELGLGFAGFSSVSRPRSLSPLYYGSQISAGGNHTCVVSTPYSVKCWGDNKYGQLGDGTTENNLQPVTVSGLTSVGKATVVDLATFSSTTCAVLSSGVIKCWGSNRFGQVGDGTSDNNRTTPVTVQGITKALQISAGSQHFCAVLTNGQVKCWGGNDDGQLGDGSQSQRSSPVTVYGITNATQVSVGFSHSCAVLSTGAVHCWGDNSYGQLGDGTTTDQVVPVTVQDISNATRSGMNWFTSCAILESGDVQCWGLNNQGQLGDGTTTDQTRPVTVQGTSDAVSISHSCAVLKTNEVKCWGTFDAVFDESSGSTSSLTAVTLPLGPYVDAKYSEPSAPSGLVVQQATGKSVMLGWYVPFADGLSVDRYRIEWSVNGVAWQSLELDQNSVTLSGLSLDTNYQVRVSAHSEAGWGQSSDILQTKTLSGIPDIPSNVNVQWAAAKSLGLAWSAPEAGGLSVDKYRMEWSVNGVDWQSVETDKNSATLSSLSLNTNYQIRVSAHSEAGWGSPSAIVQARTISGVPNAPVNPVVSDRTGVHLIVSWSEPEGGNRQAEDYELRYSFDNGATWMVYEDGESTSTSIEITGLESGKKYALQVRAVGEYGVSQWVHVGGFKQLVSGQSHTCTLTAEGTIKCWGMDKYGQLGDATYVDEEGANPDRRSPVTVTDISTAIQIAAGDFHTCALLSSGQIECWGKNFYGQLGDGTQSDRGTPELVLGISNAIQVTAGGNHTCALLSSAQVKCWGSNEYGQLGVYTDDYSSFDPVTVQDITNVAEITAGGQHTCARLSSGSVYCWGNNEYGQLGNGSEIVTYEPVRVTRIGSATQISAGWSHTCALLAGGEVKCWGSNEYWELGDGTGYSSNTPVTVHGISTATQIDAGVSHSCARLNDGRTMCWGNNEDGELGDGSTAYRNLPVTAGATNATEISAGGLHSCAVLATGEIKCWGNNENGQIGDGTAATRLAPKLVMLSVPAYGLRTAPSAPQVTVSASTATSTTLLWGTPEADGFAVDNYKIEWSTNGSEWNAAETSQPTYTVTGLSKAKNYRFRVSAHSEIGWGTTANIAVSGTGNTTTPYVSTNEGFACAVLPSGKVQCWGENESGQLGDGTKTDHMTPFVIRGLSNVTQVSAGYSHSCARLSSGQVKCWGDNEHGELGDGTKLGRLVPVSVQGVNNATQISAGASHSCARLATGAVICWGDNFYGQLGDGTKLARTTPVKVAGISNATYVTTGWGHSCALLLSGQVKCWGWNFSGQLGDGTKSNRTSPVAVKGTTTAKQISAGEAHSCAVLASGQIKCWGSNDSGQLGDGTQTGRTSPVAVQEISSATQIGVGANHSCAVLQSSQVKCWGDNENGLLGNGTYDTSWTPVSVQDLTDAKQLSVGTGNSCVVLSTSLAQCWGGNESLSLVNPELNLGPFQPYLSPAAPNIAMRSAGTNSLDLGWDVPDGDGLTIDRYKLEWSVDGIGWQSLETVSTTSTLTGLSLETAYKIRITAHSDAGWGIVSAVQSFTTGTTLSYVTGAKVLGVASVGKSLTVTNGTWTATPKVTFTYQWYSCTKSSKAASTDGKVVAGCKPVAGATKSSLKLMTAHKKLYLAVLITGKNSVGSKKVFTATLGPVK